MNILIDQTSKKLKHTTISELMYRVNAADRLDPVNTRHIDVHQNNIRMELLIVNKKQPTKLLSCWGRFQKPCVLYAPGC